MLNALNSFIYDAGDLCAGAESISPETHDKILADKTKVLLAKSTEGEHHMFGARAAVKRFQSIVNEVFGKLKLEANVVEQHCS